MSPFEAARKLLSLDSRDLHLGDRTELVFQDSDLVPAAHTGDKLQQ